MTARPKFTKLLLSPEETAELLGFTRRNPATKEHEPDVKKLYAAHARLIAMGVRITRIGKRALRYNAQDVYEKVARSKL